MITKEQILKKLAQHFRFNIASVDTSKNLFRGFIDSLDFLTYAKSIESLAQESNLKFDLEDFLYSECYSVDDIFLYLTSKNQDA